MTDLRLERHFAADPETVFAYITKPEHLLKWWGPEGMTVQGENLDFSRTSDWSSVMINGEGGRYKVSGKVSHYDPPKAVEFTWGWHDENDDRGHESRVRFEVRANDAGGTVFTVIHSGLADEESAENHNLGWTSSLRKLERISN